MVVDGANMGKLPLQSLEKSSMLTALALASYEP